MCGIGAIIHKDFNYNINKLLYEILFVCNIEVKTLQVL